MPMKPLTPEAEHAMLESASELHKHLTATVVWELKSKKVCAAHLDLLIKHYVELRDAIISIREDASRRIAAVIDYPEDLESKVYELTTERDNLKLQLQAARDTALRVREFGGSHQ